MTRKRKKKSPKPTEFCSAVEPFAHFACMRPATTSLLGQNLCAKHAKIHEPFNVYRVLPDGEYQTELVFQRPNSCQLHVVGGQLNGALRTLVAAQWHRSLKRAYAEPLKRARRDVHEARKYLAECKAVLQKMQRSHKS